IIPNLREPNAGDKAEIWSNCQSSPWTTGLRSTTDTGEPKMTPVVKGTPAEQISMFGCFSREREAYSFSKLDQAGKRGVALEGMGYDDATFELKPGVIDIENKNQFLQWFDYVRSVSMRSIAITAITDSAGPGLALQRAEKAAELLKRLGFSGIIKWV